MSTNPSTLHDVQPDGFFTRPLAEADPAVFAGVQPAPQREQDQHATHRRRSLFATVQFRELAHFRRRPYRLAHFQRNQFAAVVVPDKTRDR